MRTATIVGRAARRVCSALYRRPAQRSCHDRHRYIRNRIQRRDQRRGFGVDVGGSGVKGGIVDLDTGAADRRAVQAAHPAALHPDAVAKTIAEVVRRIRLGPARSASPTRASSPTAIVRTAANVDKGWIGTNAREVIGGALGGQPVTVLNDADAAGLAEEKFGAGKDNTGVIVLLTFGTGIGSAVIHNGVLLPNTEFGHLEVGGKEAEHRAASSVKERKEWSYERWTEEVTKVLVAIENAIWPDLFIAGGGISRKADKWIPLLKNRTPVVAAALLNTAGIVGAAMAADVDVTATALVTLPGGHDGARQICRSARRTPTLSLQWSTAAAYRDSGGVSRAEINADIRHSRHFSVAHARATESSKTERVYVAATKASPATDEPVKRTATKAPAKKAAPPKRPTAPPAEDRRPTEARPPRRADAPAKAAPRRPPRPRQEGDDSATDGADDDRRRADDDLEVDDPSRPRGLDVDDPTSSSTTSTTTRPTPTTSIGGRRSRRPRPRPSRRQGRQARRADDEIPSRPRRTRPPATSSGTRRNPRHCARPARTPSSPPRRTRSAPTSSRSARSRCSTPRRRSSSPSASRPACTPPS